MHMATRTHSRTYMHIFFHAYIYALHLCFCLYLCMRLYVCSSSHIILIASFLTSSFPLLHLFTPLHNVFSHYKNWNTFLLFTCIYWEETETRAAAVPNIFQIYGNSCEMFAAVWSENVLGWDFNITKRRGDGESERVEGQAEREGIG